MKNIIVTFLAIASIYEFAYAINHNSQLALILSLVFACNAYMAYCTKDL